MNIFVHGLYSDSKHYVNTEGCISRNITANFHSKFVYVELLCSFSLFSPPSLPAAALCYCFPWLVGLVVFREHTKFVALAHAERRDLEGFFLLQVVQLLPCKRSAVFSQPKQAVVVCSIVSLTYLKKSSEMHGIVLCICL